MMYVTTRSLAISLHYFTAFFQGEDESLEIGEHHYESGHVESCSHADGEMVGLVHASRREHCYEVYKVVANLSSG